LEDNQQEKDFFNKFFPRELIEKITTETNNYATKCIEKPDPKWKPTNVTEILAFIGLHVVMSVIQLPSYTLGWKQMERRPLNAIIPSSIVCSFGGL
jgi:hypothetical protein